jgi:hypothetical protein
MLALSPFLLACLPACWLACLLAGLLVSAAAAARGAGGGQDEVRGLCDIFYTMEPAVVEDVYESCDKQRAQALQQLMDMVGDTPQLTDSLRAEALRLHKVPPRPPAPPPRSPPHRARVRACGSTGLRPSGRSSLAWGLPRRPPGPAPTAFALALQKPVRVRPPGSVMACVMGTPARRLAPAGRPLCHVRAAPHQLDETRLPAPRLFLPLSLPCRAPRQVLLERKNLVEDSMRCPISGAPMKDPVLASDGHSYERASITKWLATKSTSPVTGEQLDKGMLVPNHQLRSEMESWAEYKDGEQPGSAQPSDLESVIPAVSSRPASAAVSSVVMEARSVSPLKPLQPPDLDSVSRPFRARTRAM